MLLRALAVDATLSHVFLEDLVGSPGTARAILVASARLMRWQAPEQVCRSSRQRPAAIHTLKSLLCSWSRAISLAARGC